MSANPIIVVDYNAGNLTSVMNALAHIGAEAKSSHDAEEIAKATRLIFPGVGAAASAMETLTRTRRLGAADDESLHQ